MSTRSTQKVTSLILYGGYAEESTNAGILLHHEYDGFDTVEDALLDLHALTKAWLKENDEAFVKTIDDGDSLEEFWSKAIRGDFQQWPNVWDAIVEGSSGCWTTHLELFHFQSRVVLARAPELISRVPAWVSLSQRDRDVILSYCDFGKEKMKKKMFKDHRAG